MERAPFVPLDESARLLGGISRGKLYLMLRSGELESRHIGRRRFVTRRSIDAYVRGDADLPAVSQDFHRASDD